MSGFQVNSRFKHALRCALLVGLALSTASCVYLRLNTLRKQLADFEKYCAFEFTVGPAIVFKKPVIKPDDTNWLLGLDPSEMRKEGASETRTWVFKKRLPAGHPVEKKEHNIVIQCDFEDGRMVRLMFPEGMEGVLNEKVVDQLFTRADEAKLEKKNTRSVWSMSEKAEFPGRDRMLEISGAPFERSVAEQKESLVYKYHLEGQETPEDQVDGAGVLIFDRSTGKMTDAKIYMGFLHITILTQDDGSYQVEVKRSRS